MTEENKKENKKTKSKKRITWTDKQKKHVIEVIILNNFNAKGGRALQSTMTWSQFENACREKLGAKKYTRTQLVGLCNRLIKQSGREFKIPEYDSKDHVRSMFTAAEMALKERARDE